MEAVCRQIDFQISPNRIPPKQDFWRRLAPIDRNLRYRLTKAKMDDQAGLRDLSHRLTILRDLTEQLVQNTVELVSVTVYHLIREYELDLSEDHRLAFFKPVIDHGLHDIPDLIRKLRHKHQIVCRFGIVLIGWDWFAIVDVPFRWKRN